MGEGGIVFGLRNFYFSIQDTNTRSTCKLLRGPFETSPRWWSSFFSTERRFSHVPSLRVVWRRSQTGHFLLGLRAKTRYTKCRRFRNYELFLHCHDHRHHRWNIPDSPIPTKKMTNSAPSVPWNRNRNHLLPYVRSQLRRSFCTRT